MPIYDEIDRVFDLHPPTSDEIRASMDDIRARYKDLAYDLMEYLPEGEERATAIRLLSESLMYSIAAIARSDANTGAAL